MAGLSLFRHHAVAETRAGSATRRRVLIGLVGIASAAYVAHGRATRLPERDPDAASFDEWQSFLARFVAPAGRVVDTGNGGVTHSEGQGYGLLFAEHFADRATFDSLLAWTQQNLRRPGDSLHAWRYRPDAEVKVEDANNATDGDLMIAWALLRAGQRWGNQDYTDQGCQIAADLLRTCVRTLDDATVLLPAAFEFEHPGRVVINPWYYIFPALQAVAAAVPDPAWDTLQADGLRLLRNGRFGRWGLPPDWLEITGNSLGNLAPAPDWPARFSWDAVRVPLNLAWAGLTTEPALAAAAAFWTDPAQAGMPAWADLGSDAPAGTASTGVKAVAELARTAVTGVTTPALPHVRDAADYYSAALVLLAHVAWQENRAAATAS